MLTALETFYTILSVAGACSSGYGAYEMVSKAIAVIPNASGGETAWHMFMLFLGAIVLPTCFIYCILLFLTATGPWEPQEVELPNGMRVNQVANGETSLLYKEIFEEACYSKVAKHVKKGSTVVDAGANIGMFSLWAAGLAGPTGRVLAFEPIPSTFARLSANLKRNFMASSNDDISKTGYSSEGECPRGGLTINEGLGDASSEPVFLSHPRMSVWSTSSEDLLESRPNATLNGIVDGALGSVSSVWRPLLRPAVWALFWPLMQIATQVEPVKCKIRTLSEHIKRLQLGRIDLLKVDVEGAELFVLRGIKPEHWPLVGAVVVETEPGNREAVMELLRTKGFAVRFEEPYSKGRDGEQKAGKGTDGASDKKSALAMVYAEREAPEEDDKREASIGAGEKEKELKEGGGEGAGGAVRRRGSKALRSASRGRKRGD